MAGNLGARPLGPILMQRFERLFDGSPRVLKTHGKEGTTVGWLDVVEFARNKPEQFNLEKMRDGVRVCQFYTKQCRVEISEDDYHLVKSGMPLNMIPPQPIAGDEEKELGTLEILEGRLSGVVQLADQVSARARQLNHRLRNRRNAIVQRREAEAVAAHEERSPMGRSTNTNGERASTSPTGGFVAVNSRVGAPSERSQYNDMTHTSSQSQATSNSLSNGAIHGASAATRAELLSKFSKNTSTGNESYHRQPRRDSNPLSRLSSTPTRPNSKPYSTSLEYADVLLTSASPQTTPQTAASQVAIPNTPSSLLPLAKPASFDRFDDSGPYKADMMARMEVLNRGDRVQPPCDRCRRLHMDCLKNLTACMGCTKKHAKCSWKEVEEQELKDHPFVPRAKAEDQDTGSDGEGLGSGRGNKRAIRDTSGEVGVRDEELLGEESEEEEPIKERPEYPKIRSQSPPRISITKVPDNLEKLPSPENPTLVIPFLQRQDNNSADTQEQPSTETVDQEIHKSDPSAPSHIPTSQMPPSYTHCSDSKSVTNSNGNAHVQTQYEKDIYSQLNDASREAEKSAAILDDPVRVYIAGSGQPERAPEASGEGVANNDNYAARLERMRRQEGMGKEEDKNLQMAESEGQGIEPARSPGFDAAAAADRPSGADDASAAQIHAQGTVAMAQDRAFARETMQI